MDMDTKDLKQRDLCRFKRRLIRTVARLKAEKVADLWEKVDEAMGKPCKNMWCLMRTLCVKKLSRLQQCGDVPGRLPVSSRMTVTDWLLFDLVLCNETIATFNTIDSIKELPQLRTLFELVQQHELEEEEEEEDAEPRSPKLVEKWIGAALDYNKEGRQCSPMLLQRRWYELKWRTREKFYKFWRIYKKVHQDWEKPSQLMQDVAVRYPHVVTAKLQDWQAMIEAGQVVLPQEFEQLMQSQTSSASDESEDVVLVEAEIETIDVDLETEIEESVTENDLEALSQCPDSESTLENCEAINNENESSNDSNTETIKVEFEGCHEDISEKDDLTNFPFEDTDSYIENIQNAVQVENFSDDAPAESEIVNKEMVDNFTPVVPVILKVETLSKEDAPEVEIVKEVEEVETEDKVSTLSKEDALEVEIVKEVEEVETEDKVSTSSDTQSYLMSNTLKPCPKSKRQMRAAENEIKSEMYNACDKPGPKCTKNLSHAEKKSILEHPVNVEKETVEVFSENTKSPKTVVELDECSYEFVDEDDVVEIDVATLKSLEEQQVQVKIENELKSEIAESSNSKPVQNIASESIDILECENSNQKFDLKLLMLPVVYTLRVDQMEILKNSDINNTIILNEHNLEILEILSKPKSNAAFKMKEDSLEFNSAIKDEFNDRTDEYEEYILQEPIVVKDTSYLFRKPKTRIYTPIKLCKNPDFNTRLRRMSVLFLTSPRNRQLLKACKPLTVDLHKTFESKLIKGKIRVRTTVNTEKSVNNIDCHTATVTPSVMPAQSLIDREKVNMSDLLSLENQQTDIKLLEARKNKSIQLLDRDKVRLVNKNLKTAQVLPLTHDKPSAATEVETSDKKMIIPPQVPPIVACIAKTQASLILDNCKNFNEIQEKPLPDPSSETRDNLVIDKRNNKLKNLHLKDMLEKPSIEPIVGKSEGSNKINTARVKISVDQVSQLVKKQKPLPDTSSETQNDLVIEKRHNKFKNPQLIEMLEKPSIEPIVDKNEGSNKIKWNVQKAARDKISVDQVSQIGKKQKQGLKANNTKIPWYLSKGAQPEVPWYKRGSASEKFTGNCDILLKEDSLRQMINSLTPNRPLPAPPTKKINYCCMLKRHVVLNKARKNKLQEITNEAKKELYSKTLRIHKCKTYQSCKCCCKSKLIPKHLLHAFVAASTTESCEINITPTVEDEGSELVRAVAMLQEETKVTPSAPLQEQTEISLSDSAIQYHNNELDTINVAIHSSKSSRNLFSEYNEWLVLQSETNRLNKEKTVKGRKPKARARKAMGKTGVSEYGRDKETESSLGNEKIEKKSKVEKRNKISKLKTTRKSEMMVTENKITTTPLKQIIQIDLDDSSDEIEKNDATSNMLESSKSSPEINVDLPKGTNIIIQDGQLLAFAEDGSQLMFTPAQINLLKSTFGIDTLQDTVIESIPLDESENLIGNITSSQFLSSKVPIDSSVFNYISETQNTTAADSIMLSEAAEENENVKFSNVTKNYEDNLSNELLFNDNKIVESTTSGNSIVLPEEENENLIIVNQTIDNGDNISNPFILNDKTDNKMLESTSAVNSITLPEAVEENGNFIVVNQTIDNYTDNLCSTSLINNKNTPINNIREGTVQQVLNNPINSYSKKNCVSLVDNSTSSEQSQNTPLPSSSRNSILSDLMEISGISTEDTRTVQQEETQSNNYSNEFIPVFKVDNGMIKVTSDGQYFLETNRKKLPNILSKQAKLHLRTQAQKNSEILNNKTLPVSPQKFLQIDPRPRAGRRKSKIVIKVKSDSLRNIPHKRIINMVLNREKSKRNIKTRLNMNSDPDMVEEYLEDSDNETLVTKVVKRKAEETIEIDSDSSEDETLASIANKKVKFDSNSDNNSVSNNINDMRLESELDAESGSVTNEKDSNKNCLLSDGEGQDSVTNEPYCVSIVESETILQDNIEDAQDNEEDFILGI